MWFWAWLHSSATTGRSNSRSNLSESTRNPEKEKPRNRAESGPTRPPTAWLWSRRSRVRVPSLTPQEGPAIGVFGQQSCVCGSAAVGPISVQFVQELVRTAGRVGADAPLKRCRLITRRSRVRIPPLSRSPRKRGGFGFLGERSAPKNWTAIGPLRGAEPVAERKSSEICPDGCTAETTIADAHPSVPLPRLLFGWGR
jgi:hypothetical protein